MRGQKREITRARLLDALSRSTSIRSAAKLAGISERTVYAYLADQDFLRAWRARADASGQAAFAAISENAPKAVEVLADSLEHGTRAERIRAAKAVIEYGFRAYELLNVVERLERLERLTGEQTDV